MKISELFRATAVILGAYLLMDTAFFRGLYNGLEFGADLCDAGPYREMGNLYAASAYIQYGSFIDISKILCWAIVAYMAGHLVRRDLLSHLISLPAIGLVVFLLFHIYRLKVLYVSEPSKYFDLMRATASSSLEHLCLGLVLLVLEVVFVLRAILVRKRIRESPVKGLT